MDEIALIRPNWDFKDYHLKKWTDITVLICQRKTKELIQLTVESLFRFYPDIPVLVVDGNSEDDSLLYLKYKSITHPNLKVFELGNEGVNSHGTTMDLAIRDHIKTKYVLLLDSDVIIERYGFIEDMLEQMQKEQLYATGTLMLVSRHYRACRPPTSDDDVLRYAHPSCSLYDVETYKTLETFVDHGAPCVYNMIDAESKGLKIGLYPVDKYVAHLSGASWTIPRTIWGNDHDVCLRPFVTFITDKDGIQLEGQTDSDFDIVPYGNLEKKSVIQHEGFKKFDVNNRLYSIRYNVHGEYVCVLSETIESFAKDFVHLLKLQAIEEESPDTMVVGGLLVIKRSLWQLEHCLI